MKVCRLAAQNHPLLSFWVAVIAEAMSERFDLARSGRKEVQRKLEEDLLLRTLPILDEGFAFKDIPDMTIACCMFAIIIGSKGSFSDKVIDGLMAAIAGAMSEKTSEASMLSLTILADRKETPYIQESVVNKVCKWHELLLGLRSQHNVGTLALGVLTSCLRMAPKWSLGRVDVVEFILRNNLLNASQLSAALISTLETTSALHQNSEIPPAVKARFVSLLQSLDELEDVKRSLQNAIIESSFDIAVLEQDIQLLITPNDISMADETVDVEEIATGESHRALENVLTHIPERTVDERTFLTPSKSHLFRRLSEAFNLATTNPSDIDTFCALPVLRKKEALQCPLFVSFFIRIVSGSYPPRSRTVALRILTSLIKGTSTKINTQTLLPYVVVALGDPAAKVRREAANLLMLMDQAFPSADQEGTLLWPAEELYGLHNEDGRAPPLACEDALKIVRRILLPVLEECVLDSTYVIRRVISAINGPAPTPHKSAKAEGKDLKKVLRQLLFTRLASDIRETPMWTVKAMLLSIVISVDKTASTPKGREILHSVLQDRACMSVESVEHISGDEGVNISLVDERVAAVIAPSEKDAIAKLLSTLMVDGRPARTRFVATVFDRIKEIWPSLKPEYQLAGVENLLDIALAQVAEHRSFSMGCRDVLRTVSMSTAVLVHVMSKAHELTASMTDQTPTPKKRRSSQNPMIAINVKDPTETALAISRLTFVLELVDGAKPDDKPELLPYLFHSLATLHHFKSQVQSELAYLLTLVLGSLLAIVNKLKVSTVSKFDSSAIRPELVIDCVRTTNSPQVQNYALLLIAGLANIFPEMVLHSVMPIFTFMGSSVLRKDDEYSAHVIDQTIDQVIPPLIHSMRMQKRDIISGTSDLLLSFTAAFEHVPTHRRLRLFQTLITKLGADDFLFAVLAMLVNKYAGNQVVTSFMTTLVSHFDIDLQLRTYEKYLGLVMDTFKEKPEQAKIILGLGTEDGRDQQAVVFALLQVLTSLLRSKDLALKVRKCFSSDRALAPVVQSLFSRLVEQVLIISDSAKGTRKLEVACHGILSALLDSLPFDELLTTLQHLLEQPQQDLQRKVLKLVEDRMNSERAQSAPAQLAALRFLPVLTDVVQMAADSVSRRSAVSCIAHISRRFGKKNLDIVATAATVVAGASCIGQNEIRLQVAGLLCLCSMVKVLGQSFIPLLPGTISRTFELLEQNMKPTAEKEFLHSAGYTLIAAFLSHIPWMISAEHLDRILTLSFISAESGLEEQMQEPAPHREVLELVAKHINPAQTLSALDKNWHSAVVTGPEGVRAAFETLNNTVKYCPKSAVVKYAQLLLRILLRAFDLRRTQLLSVSEESFGEEDITDLEQLGYDAALKVVYKMNDTTFRPIFTALVEWATDDLPEKDLRGRTLRRTSFYNFLLRFFQDLRSIVTSYAVYVIDSAVQVFNNEHPDNESYHSLWLATVRMLTAAFEHDQDEFWQSPSHFGTVSVSLLAQLRHSSTSLPIISALIPAITALAAAADSPDHHKAINLAIIKYKDSEIPAVRLAAVKCQQSLTERLGEEWLAHSAEMMVFINDLLEDDDEDVERETRRWVLRIEEVLGEDIGALLQG